jgi:hypothetical protein
MDKQQFRKVQVGVIVAAAVSGCLPFLFGGTFLPLHDEPGHMALVHILDVIGDNSNNYAERYKIAVSMTPNWFYYVWVLLVGQITPIVVAHRLFCLLFVALALPVSMIYLLRISGKDPMYAVVACAVTFHWGTTYGFTQWAAAIPAVIALAALRLHRYSIVSRRGKWIADALLFLSGIFLFGLHTFGLLIFIPLILLVMLFKTRRLEDVRVDLMTLLPGILLFLNWLSGRKTSSGSGVKEKLLVLWDEYFDKIRPFSVCIEEFEKLSIGYSIHGVHLVGYYSILLAMLGLTIYALYSKWKATPRNLTDKDVWLRLSLFTMFTAGYFYVPFYILKPINWWGISPRLLPVAFCFFVLAVAPRPSRLSIWVPFCFSFVVLFHHIAWTQEFRRFNRVEMAGYQEILDALPSAKRVLPVLSHRNTSYRISPFPHMGSYAMLQKDAEIPHGMVHNKDYWVKWNKRFPNVGWGTPGRVRKSMLAHYDYFIVRSPPTGKKWIRFGDVPPARLERVVEKGKWALWRVLE